MSAILCHVIKIINGGRITDSSNSLCFLFLFYFILSIYFLPMFVTDGNVKFPLEMRENKDQAAIHGSGLRRPGLKTCKRDWESFFVCLSQWSVQSRAPLYNPLFPAFRLTGFHQSLVISLTLSFTLK